jgi:YHS domain-containing protein
MAEPEPDALTPKEIAMAIDPVCKMTVEPARAAAQSRYRGQTYYFCAVGCKQQFDKDPQQYLSK